MACTGTDMDETEPGNLADNARTDSEKQDIPHQWPYLIELSEVVGSRKKCILLLYIGCVGVLLCLYFLFLLVLK